MLELRYKGILNITIKHIQFTLKVCIPKKGSKSNIVSYIPTTSIPGRHRNIIMKKCRIFHFYKLMF